MPSNRLDYDQRYWLEHGHKQTLKVRLAEAEAEIRRLRSALQKIAEGAHGDYVGAGIGWRLGHQAIEHIARTALGHAKDG
jgi:hypothetical protein